MDLVYFFICLQAARALGYKTHSSINSVIFNNLDLPPENVHSEYFFGACASRDMTLVAHVTHNFDEIENKMFIQKELQVKEFPRCVYLRATSTYNSVVRYHSFKFNICLCRLEINYGDTFFVTYFYEWYLPVEMVKDVVWDIYFYDTP